MTKQRLNYLQNNEQDRKVEFDDKDTEQIKVLSERFSLKRRWEQWGWTKTKEYVEWYAA